MKRTTDPHFSLPPFFRRGNVFHLFPPRPTGRVRVLPRYVRPYSRTRIRAHARVGVHSRLVCVTCLRHGGSVACRNVRLKERLARTGSLPFPRRQPSKGVVSCISATTQSETDNGPRVSALNVKDSRETVQVNFKYENARMLLKSYSGIYYKVFYSWIRIIKFFIIFQSDSAKGVINILINILN